MNEFGSSEDTPQIEPIPVFSAEEFEEMKELEEKLQDELSQRMFEIPNTPNQELALTIALHMPTQQKYSEYMSAFMSDNASRKYLNTVRKKVEAKILAPEGLKRSMLFPKNGPDMEALSRALNQDKIPKVKILYGYYILPEHYDIWMREVRAPMRRKPITRA